ncbi:MAG TPA: efflux RND transporter periplasmic adaptor subunit [Gammaproteobacteria bacterium]|jgi:HlyD family secretion protein|nr:efflux RND transporter periplasmic adaptor subunit [Gammaproteobacteria bacterium]
MQTLLQESTPPAPQDEHSGEAFTADTAARRRRRLRIAAGAVLMALVAATAAYLMLRGRQPAYTYSTTAAVHGPLTVTVTATGQLAPVTQVDIGSEVSGTIEHVEADYNTRVRAGQVLARINTDKLSASAAQARAARNAADAHTTDAQAVVKMDELALWRCSTLHAKGLCSQEAEDEARAALDRARAALAAAVAEAERAGAALKVAETDLSKAVIRSPIDGIVLTRAAEPGQTVTAAFQSPVLFTLAQDLAHMELDVDVDEADIGSVKEGEPASFSVDAYPDRSFPAKLTQVRFGPKTIQGVVTYQAVLMVDNHELLLRPGMTATATITVKKIQDALLVPNTALRFQPPETEEGSHGLVGSLLPHPPRSLLQVTRAPTSTERDIWVLRDGQPTSVRIVIGASDGSRTQVLSGGLEPGMQVITDMTAAKK